MKRTPLLLSILTLCSFSSLAVGSLSARVPGDEPEKLKLDSDWLESFPLRSIGPANMGGRCIAIAVNKDDPSTYWIATASGGLLKTQNAGRSYEHQFDHENTVSIGHVAVAPSNPEIVWVGTGEANPRNSVSYGDGVYKSEDGGATWKHMGLKESFQTGRIAIHPEDPDTVYVGALGRLYGSNEERGLYKTTNGGKKWERILYVDEKTGVVDIDMDPTDPNTLIVATYERERDGFDTNAPAKTWGPGTAIYRTTDAGQTWEKLTNGLPSCEKGRIGIDFSRQTKGLLFAVIETERIGTLPEDAAFMGMSGEDADVGARLTRVTKEGPAEKAGFKTEDIVLSMGEHRILGYDDLMLAIREHKAGDKVKAEIVRERALIEVELEFGEYEEDARARSPFASFLGGQQHNIQDKQGRESVETGGIYKSADGGSTWERINSLNPRPMYYSQIRVDPSDDQRLYILGTSLWRSEDGGATFTSDGADRSVHVDHHALWIDPADGRHMILGNDGGIYITHDRMAQWDHHNHVAIGQFYHVTVDNRPLYNAYGGLQDNGSWGAPNRTRERSGTTNSHWLSIGGGDGFVCRTDPNDPDQVYSESQGGAMGWRNLRTGEGGGARPRSQRGVRYRFNWETPFLLSNHNSRIFYAAGSYVFRSLDRGNDLRAISPEITLTDRGSATALAESPHDPDVLWVGTDDGALWVTRDGGDNWIDLRKAPPLEDPALSAERRTTVLAELLQDLDVDDDGSLTGEEIPARLAEALAHADISGDGTLQAAEIQALTGIDREAEKKAAADADPLAGKWKIEVLGEAVPPTGKSFELEIKVTDKEKGERSGEFSGKSAKGPIADFSYDEDTKKVSWTHEADDVTTAFSATLGDAGLVGTLSIAADDFSAGFKGERTATASEEEEDKPKKKKGKKSGPTIAELLPEPMWVSSLEASRHEEGRVYLAIDGHRSDHDEALIYVSEDYGASWRSLANKLPRGSVRCLREDRDNENVLYLGTEFGAWISIDRGTSWARLDNLPTVAVHEFAQHETLGDVVIGTHGRSLWVLDTTTLRQLTQDSTEAEAWLYKPAPVYRWRSLPSRGSNGTRSFTGENPPSGAHITYSLSSKAKDFSLSILGAGGEPVAVLEAESKKGQHTVSWNLRQTQAQEAPPGEGRRGRRRGRGRSVSPGTYQVLLEVDGKRFVQPLVIKGDPDYPELVPNYETVEEAIEAELEHYREKQLKRYGPRLTDEDDI